MKTNVKIIMCRTFSEALALLLDARAAGLRAAYLPYGGIDAHRDIPVSHRVVLCAGVERIETFLTMKGGR